METANFQSLFKTLFWIFIIYYAVKFLARLFLPVLAKKVVEKASEQFQKQQQQNYTNQTTNTNTASKSDKPHETKKVGEYVDFEEID
jgi:ABC-type transport system involved in cytochrome bd biosynthesis fused ATPase/permease subunit